MSYPHILSVECQHNYNHSKIFKSIKVRQSGNPILKKLTKVDKQGTA